MRDELQARFGDVVELLESVDEDVVRAVVFEGAGDRSFSAGGDVNVVGEFVDDLVTGPPIALRKAKRVVNQGRDQDLDAALEMESRAFALLLTTGDEQVGLLTVADGDVAGSRPH